LAFLGFLCTLFLLIVVLVFPLDFTTGCVMSLSVTVCTLIIFWCSVAVQVGGVVGEAGAVFTG